MIFKFKLKIRVKPIKQRFGQIYVGHLYYLEILLPHPLITRYWPPMYGISHEFRLRFIERILGAILNSRLGYQHQLTRERGMRRWLEYPALTRRVGMVMR